MSEIFSDVRSDGVNGTDADDVIVSSGNTSSINGGNGNDAITASGYLVTADGGNGDDFIYLTNSYIAANGGDGNDIIMVGNGTQDIHIANVTLTGGAGKDTFAFFPSDYTISADITDFNPNEDTLVLIRDVETSESSITPDFSSLGAGEFVQKDFTEDDIRNEEVSRVSRDGLGYNYDSDKVANGVFINSPKLGLHFNLQGITNLTDIQNVPLSYLNINNMAVTENTFDNMDLPVEIERGLSIHQSNADNRLYVYPEFNGDIYLGGVDWKGNAVESWSDTTINDVNAILDTVSGRMLAGNAQSNYIYAGSGGASLWGGTGGRDILYGGAGADTFIAATSDNESLTRIYDFGDDDIVYLANLKATDIFSTDSDTAIYIENISPISLSEAAWIVYDGGYYVNIYGKNYSDGEPDIYAFAEYDGTNYKYKDLIFQFSDGYKLQYNCSDNYWYVQDNNGWTPYAIAIGSLETYINADGHEVLKVNADYRGSLNNIQYSDYFSSIDIIDASAYTVGGRVIAGNRNDNTIYAGVNGAEMDGVRGNNTLVGGAGADTFVAGKGEGNNTFLNCSNDDIVRLSISLNELTDFQVSTDENGNESVIKLTTIEDTTIEIRQAADANITNIYLSDESKWQYDRNASGEWWERLTRTADPIPEGLSKYGNSIEIDSNYEGDLYLGGVDWNGDTVESWQNSSIRYIYDYSNINDRVLAGNANINYIHANNYGATIWGGGSDGTDSLVGGTGDDTFVAGKGEGNVYIDNCNNNDLVYLYNINLDDIDNMRVYKGSFYDRIRVTTSDGDYIDVWSYVNSVSTTKFRLADGTDTIYSHLLGRWLSDSDDTMISDGELLSAGLVKSGNTAYVYPSYGNDTVNINDLNDSSIVNIDARNDTVSSRHLIGDAQSNAIRAGSGGTWLWGGDGGNDSLYGSNEAADIFQVGFYEGDKNIFYCEEDDLIYLYNVTADNVTSISTYEGNDYNCLRVHQNDGSVIRIWYDPIATEKITMLYADGSEKQYIVDSDEWQDIPEGLLKMADVVSIGSAYEGDLYLGGVDLNGNTVDGWSDSTGKRIDARSDTVSGRMLAGNSNENNIYAGSGGASLWGGNNTESWYYDKLYGGDGADTFIAGQNEGGVQIYNYGNGDVVVFHNINVSDIAEASFNSESGYWQLITPNRDYISVHFNSDTTITKIQYANGEQRTFDHATGNWQDLFADTDTTLPTGLNKIGNVLTVSSAFEGDIWLSGADYNGSTVEGWSDTTVEQIDATQDTVSGRMLAGNSNSNYIYAGSGGASMWGGTGGWNDLYGGAGKDTFIAGQNDYHSYIYDCGDEDILYLYDIYYNTSINWSINAYDYYTYLRLRYNSNTISIVYENADTDTTKTRVKYASGEIMEFNRATQSWETVSTESDLPFDNGLMQSGTTVLVSSEFAGDVALRSVDWNGSRVDGWSDTTVVILDATRDTVGGRMLAGNSNNNTIYAGSGGASLWGGGNTGLLGNDYLYGGGGADTFIAGKSEGNVQIRNCGDDDIVVLHNINVSDIAEASLNTEGNYLRFRTTNADNIYINYADDTTMTKIQYANGEQRTFDHSTGNWQDLFADTDTTLPTGLNKIGNVLTVSSAFEGDIWLSGADYNGSTVEGWSDTTVEQIDATQDTVSGRMLAGNSNSNHIYAGSGGASLWGGIRGLNDLYGGAGADTFIAGQKENVGNYLETEIYDCGDKDIIYLYNINLSDSFNWSVDNRTSSTYLRLTDPSDSKLSIQYSNSDTDTAKTRVKYASGEIMEFNFATQSWNKVSTDTDPTVDSGLLQIGTTVYLSSAYVGDVALGGVDWNGATVNAWSDTTIGILDATQDTVSGRMLAGNSNDNTIYAGSGGASLWGGTGGLYNDLYGGNGADTFIAGKGEGNPYIRNCADNDIVDLYNITPDQITDVNFQNVFMWLNFSDGDGIYIFRDSDTASTTTFRYSDGDTRTLNYAENNWYDVFADNSVTLPDGLTKVGSQTIYLSSNYAGDFYLGNIDVEGNEVEGLALSEIVSIDANNDTVSGRMLAGDANDNTIRAGSGGVSLWGGNGGNDKLYGGDGADTFIAGKGEGNVDIRNCGDDDIVVLHDINVSDIAKTAVNTLLGHYVAATTAGGMEFKINYDRDATQTVIQYADGERRTFNHAEGNWQDLFLNISSTLPPGLSMVNGNLSVSSAYEGDLWLGGVDLNGNTVESWTDDLLAVIDAKGDTVSGRMLAGSSNDNTIYAGSGGVSVWGGNGGYDVVYGGAGADTILAGEGDSNTSIFDCADDDIIVLYNINPRNAYPYLYKPSFSDFKTVRMSADSLSISVIHYDSETSKTMTMQFGTGDILSFDYETENWKAISSGTDSTLPNGLIELGTTVFVTSSYVGDVALSGADWNGSTVDAWSDDLIGVIDARADTVGGRMLAGNSNKNSIYAGSGGASLWGGKGGLNNSLYGGAGADTFIAGQNEYWSYIYDCGDEDIVYLHNVTPDDVERASLWSYLGLEYLNIDFKSGYVYIYYDTDTTSSTTIRYANGDTRTFNHAEGNWQDLFADNDIVPDGLIKNHKNITLTSVYEGDLWLGGVELNGSTVESWSNTVVTGIDASADTVGGRMIAGNAQSNVIHAGSGGVSLWGGNDTVTDYFYGGNGADTFIAGQGEGNSYIRNCAADDLILLYNINPGNVVSTSVYADSGYIDININDNTNIGIYYNSETTSTTTIQYATGLQVQYNNADNSWSTITAPVETSLPSGLTQANDTIQVSSEFNGNVILGSVDWNGETINGWSGTTIANIDASSDTVNGRLLAGDSRGNRIRAGSGGASLFGGDGGYDHLYGGNGADTFFAGQGAGVVDIRSCADDDIIVLYNLNTADISNVSMIGSGSDAYMRIRTTDNTIIFVNWSSDTTKTTFQLADGEQRVFDHATGDVQKLFEEITEGATGLTVGGGNTVSISSEFDGNVVLGGVDWNGETINGWSDTSIEDIDARNDTVGGRILAGNENDNYIYAGSGGASLWGGNGGSNGLHGGDGADTFIITADEDYLNIDDCDDDDVILLHNLNPSAVSYKSADDDDDYIYFAVNDELWIYVFRKSGATKTTLQYADGTVEQYDHAVGTWSTLQSSGALDEMWGDNVDESFLNVVDPFRADQSVDNELTSILNVDGVNEVDSSLMNDGFNIGCNELNSLTQITNAVKRRHNS